MRLIERSLFSLSLLAVVALPARGQVVLYEVQGSPGDLFGFDVIVIDDRDGDGLDDWVVGAPEGQGQVTGSGYVEVRSGADGGLLARIDGVQAGDEFGSALAWIGDMDLDGVRDLLIGAPGAGEVSVWSLASYTSLLTLNGAGAFGSSLAALGDVDQDGRDDFGVGAPSTSGPDVHVFAADGSLIRTHTAANFLGTSFVGLADVDADGVPDYAVGDRIHDSNVGRVRAYSGASGSELWTTEGYVLPGDPFCQRFGISLLEVADQDGDGVADLLAGADGFACFVGMPGRVAVLSGVDGALLHELMRPSDSRFGFDLAPAGDVDLDGTDDWICGEPSYQRPSGALVLSGADASTVLGSLVGPSTSSNRPFGHAVAGAARFDPDPFPDLLVGAPEETFGAGNPGRVIAWSLACPPAAGPYCPASAHSSGFANLEQVGSTSFASGDFELSVSSAPGNKAGIFFVGTQAVNLPFGDGRRCAGGAILRLNPVVQTTPVGRASRLTPPAGLPGVSPFDTRYFQFWFRDPAAGGAGFNLTNGLRATFCE